MEKRVHEQLWLTLAIAAIGFAILALAVPEWARLEVLVFGAIYGLLVVAMDDDVRDALRRSLDSRPRGNDSTRRNDTTSARAKAPASRRAAT